ncbi:hypothetical protein TNCV_4289691 [Trichonephila clavipes]|nr:hypothetical protein TNCV_4289691 [Trichonephila clavipes]
MASPAKEQKMQDSKCNSEFQIGWTKKHSIICKGDKNAKLSIYKTLLRPIALNGSKCWSPNKKKSGSFLKEKPNGKYLDLFKRTMSEEFFTIMRSTGNMANMAGLTLRGNVSPFARVRPQRWGKRDAFHQIPFLVNSKSRADVKIAVVTLGIGDPPSICNLKVLDKYPNGIQQRFSNPWRA